ncbi:hypothetical protein C7475_105372 [Chitinophaga sp. S165]|nr:hypothetical protein C7475_105372 [Chitinophaga sp. S165]
MFYAEWHIYSDITVNNYQKYFNRLYSINIVSTTGNRGHFCQTPDCIFVEEPR